MNVYATPDEVKVQIGISGATHDEHLLRVLVGVSRLIDQATGRRFAPEVATRNLDSKGDDTLWLPVSLLAVTSIQLSDDDGDTYDYTLAGTDYWLSSGAEYDQYPYQVLVMNPNGNYPTLYAGVRSVKVVGVWGWHDDYDNAWASVDTVQDDPLTAGATSLTVADIDGVDEWGLTPRIQVGQLLRLGSEFVAVTAVNTGTDVATIRRGQNGSTAASHAQGTAVEVWRPFEGVKQACITQAARTFKRGQQAFQDASANVEMGQLYFTRKLDQDVEALLVDAGLRRVTV